MSFVAKRTLCYKNWGKAANDPDELGTELKLTKTNKIEHEVQSKKVNGQGVTSLTFQDGETGSLQCHRQ